MSDISVQINVFSTSQAIAAKNAIKNICKQIADENWCWRIFSETSSNYVPSVYVWANSTVSKEVLGKVLKRTFPQFIIVSQRHNDSILFNLHPSVAKGRSLTFSEWCSLLDSEDIKFLIDEGILNLHR